MEKHDYLIIGGGIVGLATAYRLSLVKPNHKILLLEKETDLGQHQSTHNSGVLHAGLYYKPGSLKAELSVQGLRMMVDFCQKHGVAYEQCGKIVVATNDKQLKTLEKLWHKGKANGLHGLEKLDPEQIKMREPYATGKAAILVPEEGIVDYAAVINALRTVLEQRNVLVLTGRHVKKIYKEGAFWYCSTNYEMFRSKYVITCCGLYSDLVVRKSELKSKSRIIPFRGEYYKIKKEKEHLVRHLIYPVPDDRFPFLGVHFTRMVNGGIEAGPNAVLAFAREGYSWKHFNLKETIGILSYPGLWAFLLKYPSLCSYEIYRSFCKKEFCRSLQQLVPAITENDLETGPRGVRAQAMRRNGKLVEDFDFVQAENILHVVNAPSPAATASLAIAKHIVEKIT